MSALQRLSRASPGTMELRELMALPPGPAMGAAHQHVSEGRVSARTLLSTYTECVRRALSTRVDGHPAPSEAQDVRGETPGPRQQKYSWSCVGPARGGWLPFKGSVDPEEARCFAWHPEQHAWRHAEGSEEVDTAVEKLLKVIFFDPPSLEKAGHGAAVATHKAQEVAMWRAYHPLVDLWAWAPDKETGFGRGARAVAYTVQVRGGGAYLISLRTAGGELCDFVWHPAKHTLAPLGGGVDVMLSLFVTPPRLA